MNLFIYWASESNKTLMPTVCLDNIEDNCRATANRYLPCLGKQPARVFENQTWVRPIPQGGIEQTAASETVTHYASAMDIDEPYYGSSRT
ncbi:hypothetical protein NPX13_g3266 [Xylaria arbuscula]|uniref:Uncharacterized protein n=1 Tax=Xylaria arbuscula TaxID=114810 RepID=A0A9W8TPI2_9PEZI|nr:hypothetical protein NPX13_g3266 [Xylaria arbuscula]